MIGLGEHNFSFVRTKLYHTTQGELSEIHVLR